METQQKQSQVTNIDFSFYGSNEDAAETRSVATRRRLRTQVSQDVEAYLQSGGKVVKVADNVRADPPRRPSTANYGSAPI